MSINLSKKLLSVSAIALLSVATLSACGGSGSSSAPIGVSPPPPPPPPPTGVSFSLGGGTTKGLILNGNVDVVDAANPSTVLVNGTTSATDGTYDLTIPDTANFSGPFVIVTVSGGGNAMMICDAAVGCVDSAGTAVNFGDSFPIDSTVTLSAIVPTPADGQSDTVNLNIFTDLAASLAMSDSGSLTETAINDANAQVGNLFGLGDTNPADLAPINIADPATIISDPTDLRAGLISGGVLGAALENGSDIGAALETLRTSFATNDGQILVNETVDDPAVISLEDIFSEATDAADASGIEGDDVVSVEAQLFGEANETRGAQEDELSNSTVAPSNNAPALDQAKAFVSDLQLIVAAVDQPNADNLQDFADRVEMAADLISGDTNAAIDAALAASEAIALAFQAHEDDNSLTTFTANSFDVDISTVNGDLSLVIAEQTVGNETVEMSVIGDLDVVLTETASQSDEVDDNGNFISEISSDTLSISIGNDAEIMGSVENASVSLEILGGEVSVLNGSIAASETGEFFGSDPNTGAELSRSLSEELMDLSADRVTAELDIILMENRTDGLLFDGVASASLVGPQFRSEELFSNFFMPMPQSFSQTFLEVQELSAALESSDISFSGEFSEGGQSINLSLALRVDGQDLSFDTLPDPVDIATVTQTGDVLSFSSVRSEVRFELLSAADAQQELDGGILGDFSITVPAVPFGPPVIDIYQVDGVTRAAAAITDTAAPVLRFEQIDADPAAPDGVVLFAQSDTMTLLFGATPLLPDGFVDNPPNNIIDFYNQGFVRTETPFPFCAPTGPDFTDLMLQPFVVTEPFFVAGQTTVQGIPVTESIFSNSGAGICDVTPFDDVQSNFSPEGIVNFDPNATATGLFATSITQNIAGIDPDDTDVTASLFGPLSFSQGEVGGDLTLTLEFAGRTFETNARDVAIFDDLSEPITVTNQDGVVMVISEDQNGDATGSVSLDGVEQGVISDTLGGPIVTFTDDTFVSLQ